MSLLGSTVQYTDSFKSSKHINTAPHLKWKFQTKNGTNGIVETEDLIEIEDSAEIITEMQYRTADGMNSGLTTNVEFSCYAINSDSSFNTDPIIHVECEGQSCNDIVEVFHSQSESKIVFNTNNHNVSSCSGKFVIFQATIKKGSETLRRSSKFGFFGPMGNVYYGSFVKIFIQIFFGYFKRKMASITS